jgi:creatinine amidohydrolase
MPVLVRSGVAAVSPSGVLGDPSGATAETGLAIVDRWASALIAALDRWP